VNVAESSIANENSCQKRLKMAEKKLTMNEAELNLNEGEPTLPSSFSSQKKTLGFRINLIKNEDI
jgi:hypothetical protein